MNGEDLLRAMSTLDFENYLEPLKAVPCEVHGGRLHLLLTPLFFTEPIIVPQISKLLANGDTSNIFLCVLLLAICCQQIKFMKHNVDAVSLQWCDAFKQKQKASQQNIYFEKARFSFYVF